MKNISLVIFVVILITYKPYAQNTTTYQYDNHNRLSNSTDENTSIQYTFDQLGNRLLYNLTSQTPSQADLLVENISIPSNSLEQGASLLASCDVSNTGIADAGGSYLKVYLSNTTTGTDTELKSIYISSIAAGSNESLSFSITIPQNATAGNKYLVFFADATTVIPEPNENNNKANVAITILLSTSPDLTIQNQVINPTSLLAGESTYVSASIMNTGNENAGSFWLRCYLSINPTFESYNDTELTDAAFNYSSLNAGATSAYAKNVNIPSNTVAGTYYLLFVADPENTISEQDEDNNVVYSTLIVTIQGGGSTPISNFSVDNQFIGTGTTVQFTDASTNSPNSWQWSFPGGSPSVSTAQNPNITYNTNGIFDATLTTSNLSGSNTVTQTNLISVGQVSDYNWIWQEQLSIDINDVTTDENGNIVLTGGDTYTMYLGKYSPEGTELWLNTISNCRGRALDVSSNGDIIVVGEFSGTVNFGNNITIANTYNDGTDGYIARFNNNGQCIWANKIYNSDVWNTPNSRTIIIMDVCFDNADNSYITGYFEGLYGGSDYNYLRFPNGITLRNEDQSNNLLVAKFSPTGTTLWAKEGEEHNNSGSYFEGFSIDTDGAHIGIVGQFSQTAIFNNQTSYIRTASGLYDIFFLECNASNGYLTTFNKYGSNSTSTNSWDQETGHDIKYTDGGQKYICGQYTGTALFGGTQITSAGHADAFLMKLSSSCSVSWVISGGSTNLDCARDLSIAPDNDVYMVGQHDNGFTTEGTSIDGYGTFIGKYDATGNITSIKNVSSTFYNYSNSGGIEAESESNLFFGAVAKLAKYGVIENVLHPLLQCSDTSFCTGESSIITAPAGYENYSWNNGDTTSSIVANTAGNYWVEVSDNLDNTGTSDTMSISVLSYPTASITAVGSTTFCEGGYVELNANTGTNLTYRWLKDGDYITGATTETYLAYTNGDYQIEVSNQGECSVLSNTITLISEPIYAYLSITATETNINSGTEVTFTATPTNEGSSPQYQWQINGINIGTNNSIYMSSTLTDGDEVTCILIASGTCISNNPILSNTIVIIVDQLQANFEIQNITIVDGQTECYNATSTIVVAGSGTTVDIVSGAKANFISGGNILFKPGFHAYSGSHGHAYITTTANYCSQQESIIDIENVTLTDGEAECYNATTTITIAGSGTTVEIMSGGEATFISGGNILIKPGFYAHIGSYAHAYITTNGEYCNQQQNMLMIQDPTETVHNPTEDLLTEESEKGINIYPNPTTGRFTIDFMGEVTTADLILFDLQGNKLIDSSCRDQLKHEMDISQLQMGLYIVVIKTQEEIITRKVIKNY